MPDGSGFHTKPLVPQLPYREVNEDKKRRKRVIRKLRKIQAGIDLKALGKDEMMERFHDLIAQRLVEERAKQQSPQKAIMRWLVILNIAMEGAKFGRHDHWLVRSQIEGYLRIRFPGLKRQPQLLLEAISRFQPM